MKSKGLQVFIVLLSLVTTACGKKPSAVIIIDEEYTTIIGELAKQPTTAKIRGGEINLVMTLSGNIVVFREDSKFHGLEGGKGRAYEINEGCTFDSAEGLSNECILAEVGAVDLNEPDEKIAQNFGIPSGSRIVRTSRKANEKRTQPVTDWRQPAGFPDKL